jgi:hypothetical protein
MGLSSVFTDPQRKEDQPITHISLHLSHIFIV